MGFLLMNYSIDRLYELSMALRKRCFDVYRPPRESRKMAGLKGINYGVGGHYDLYICPRTKFAERFVRLLVDSGTLAELTLAADVKVISNDEIEKLGRDLKIHFVKYSIR